MPSKPKPPGARGPSGPAASTAQGPASAPGRPARSPQPGAALPPTFVEDHLPFVRSIARKLREHLPAIDFDDLVAFGVQGLMEAAQRYDPSHGAVFSTFAYYRVRGAMFDGLRNMGWLPRGEYARLRVEERSNAYLENLAAREEGARSAGGGEAPSLEEDVAALSSALSGVATVFVTLLGRAEEEALVDGRPLAAEELERHQQADRVRRALSRLPEKERFLIETYYFEDQTLEQVGARLGLSKSWTSRLHARAVALLRDALAAESE